jgi:hypothetical protein
MFLFFPDVTAIIYVVACSSYNLVLREDPSQVGMAQKIEIKTSKFPMNSSHVANLTVEPVYIKRSPSGISQVTALI